MRRIEKHKRLEDDRQQSKEKVATHSLAGTRVLEASNKG